ncbi:hypothetical protein QJS10_CPA01g01311 [Acorus calamus]|uniref:Uncharacterized protein n=1 Tax=Acorus calamus TaxID=4465 RepID=A0AAV9FMS7_ACOCL|nr:hypothetical protein QJS10_CPA01g01311 [Acorus calamus]
MSSFGSPIHREIPAVDEPPPEPIPTVDHEGEEGSDEEDEEEFEFAFVSDSGAITADEIFSNGQIRPIYPVFNRDLLIPFDRTETSKADPIETLRLPLRKLLIDDREPPSSSSSEAGDLDGVPAESYCVWTPSSVPPTPDRCKKSNSTGSSRRWRFRDLVVGRSNSDGKEKFVFLSASSAAARSKPPAKEEEKAAAVKGGGGKKKGKVSVTAEHRMQYGKGFQGGGGGGGSDRRRTFLPYRQDLVGFFANVNGLSKTYQPF